MTTATPATSATTSLSLSTLPDITGADVPAYARKDLSAGIVHLGVGNFHRAHQIVYLDRLFNRGLDRDFAGIGAGRGPARGEGGDGHGAAPGTGV